MRLVIGCVVVALSLAAACASSGGGTQAAGDVTTIARAPRDTLVGRVYDTKDAPESRVMGLQLRDGTHLVLGGQPSIQMRALANVGAVVEAWVIGRREGTTFEVDDFEVLRVGIQAVDDGHLLIVGNRLMLVTRSGERRAVADPPAPLRYLAGSRVWIVRSLPRPNPPYGIIVRK
jgi:hypothetical protein